MDVTRWVAVLLTVLLLSSGRSRGEDTASLAGARSEGTVVWYTTLVIDQIARPMAAAFEAKYPGIRVQYARRSNPATAGLVLMESRAGTPRADVVDGTSVLEPLEAAGLLATLPPPPGYPKELVDPEGRWAATNIYFLGAAYNTDLVKAADVPRSFEDLLDPRWTGQIAWTNDQTPNGPPGFIYDVLQTS
jgi:ABC-type Fe3+ transport system substrate-binding protein